MNLIMNFQILRPRLPVKVLKLHTGAHVNVVTYLFKFEYSIHIFMSLKSAIMRKFIIFLLLFYYFYYYYFWFSNNNNNNEFNARFVFEE